MFKMPKDIIANILSSMTEKEIREKSRVDKLFRSAAGIALKNKLTELQIFYTVGAEIPVEQDTMVSGKKPRSKINREEIIDSLKKLNSLQLFATREEAEEYARYHESKGYKNSDGRLAVFAIKDLRFNPATAELKQEEIVDEGSHRVKKVKNTFTYLLASPYHSPTILYAKVRGYPEINEPSKACSIQ